MKLLIIIATVATSLLSIDAYAARGRVQIQNGTIVADDGSLLRGAHFAWTPTTPWKDDDAWTNLRDNYGLNTVRYGIRITVSKDSFEIMPQSEIDAIKADADDAVNYAKTHNMYIIIDNHSNCCLKSSRPVVERFWREFAARYKDETHVIYELQNEPGPSTGLNAAQIDLQGVWTQVRAAAPDTHIVLWSFSEMISDLLNQVSQGPAVDYVANNLSVGIHPYGIDFAQAENVRKAGYPIIFTEFAKCCGLSDTTAVFEYAERQSISWAFLDFNASTGVWQGVFDPLLWPTHLWKDSGVDKFPPSGPTNLHIRSLTNQ